MKQNNNNLLIIISLVVALVFLGLILKSGGFLMAAEKPNFSYSYLDKKFNDGWNDTYLVTFQDEDGNEVQAEILITEVFHLKDADGKECSINPQQNALIQYATCYPKLNLTEVDVKKHFDDNKVFSAYETFLDASAKKILTEVVKDLKANPDDPRIIKPASEEEPPVINFPPTPEPGPVSIPGLSKNDTLALVYELELVDDNINSTNKDRADMAKAFKACFKNNYQKYRDAAYLIDQVDGCFKPVDKPESFTKDFSLTECESRYGTKDLKSINNAAQKEALELMKTLRDNFPDVNCLERAWKWINCGTDVRCNNAKNNLNPRYDDFFKRLRSCTVIAPNPGRPPQQPVPNPVPNIRPNAVNNLKGAQNATFIIKGTGGLGSTFFIGKSNGMCVFATNDHVVKDSKNLCVDLNKNGACDNFEGVASGNVCTDGNQSLDGDVALVKLPCTDDLNKLPQLTFIDWPATGKNGAYVLPDSCKGKLYQVGYPSGKFTTKECKFNLFSYTPEQIAEFMRQGKPFTVAINAPDGTPNIDCGLTPGASGGPIVNEKGEVCVIISTLGVNGDNRGGPANSSYINKVLAKCPGFKLD